MIPESGISDYFTSLSRLCIYSLVALLKNKESGKSRRAKMENSVDLVFTEAYLMPKKHYEFLGKASMETEEGEPQKNQKTDIVKVAATSLSDESDFSDFPDLNQPLPEVSIREQLRLTSLNRGKVLSWQRGQHRHLVAKWHSRPTGGKIQE